ncbi:hypothetical protein ACI1TW_04440 [Lactococcus garvieae]|uniref:hypothetical protein n=1 Tax=Lactococcus garvieae TaxID=1363 RepID=UPI003854F1E9
MTYNQTAQHSTAQHSTAQHSTAQHSTSGRQPPIFTCTQNAQAPLERFLAFRLIHIYRNEENI